MSHRRNGQITIMNKVYLVKVLQLTGDVCSIHSHVAGFKRLRLHLGHNTAAKRMNVKTVTIFACIDYSEGMLSR